MNTWQHHHFVSKNRESKQSQAGRQQRSRQKKIGTKSEHIENAKHKDFQLKKFNAVSEFEFCCVNILASDLLHMIRKECMAELVQLMHLAASHEIPITSI